MSEFKLKHWDDVKTFKDEGEQVTKFVFTKEDAVVETVLYRYPTYMERTVICHSVMSGCPMGCRFCGTGDFFVRNLTKDEMLEQVDYALWYACQELQLDAVNWTSTPNDIEKLQIMSMSMGEPMLNKNVDKVYRTLHWLYPNAALLMSTSAPDVDYEWFFTLAEDVPTVGMQFSVHESTDEARNKLIPFEKKLTLTQMAAKGTEFAVRTNRKPFFNYCAGEHNSSPFDAMNLEVDFNPKIWEATVSVICEQDSTGGAKSNQHQKDLAAKFSEHLVKLGYNVRVFDPAGQDTIGGGCGQLWFVQDWMKQNPEKARPSCGAGKEKVGAPVIPIIPIGGIKKGELQVFAAGTGGKSLWDSVVATSDKITKVRSEQDVASYAMTELGELMEEIIINSGRSYKKPGKDGVVGEAVDVIICMVDLIRRHNPKLTETDIVEIARRKCSKWEHNDARENAERRQPGQGWTDYGT